MSNSAGINNYPETVLLPYEHTEEYGNDDQAVSVTYGKSAAKVAQQNKLELESAATTGKARTFTKIDQPIYSKLGTQLTSSDNPFASHKYDSLLNNEQPLHITLPEGIESYTVCGENIRLQAKIIKRQIGKIKEKIHLVTVHSLPKNPDLTEFFNIIKECYIKCWKMQALLSGLMETPCNFDPDKLSCEMKQFEDDIVDFMVAYQPNLDQKTNFFSLCIWYIASKSLRTEGDSTNSNYICKKVASLFSDNPITQIDLYNKCQLACIETPDCSTRLKDRDLAILLLFGLKKAFRFSGYDNQPQDIAINIENLIITDPVFQALDSKTITYNLEIMKSELSLLSNATVWNFSNKNLLDVIHSHCCDDNSFYLIKYIYSFIGFVAYTTSSPDIALIALHHLYEFRAQPSVRKILNKYSNALMEGLAYIYDPYNLAFLSILQFLLNQSYPDSIHKIRNQDLVFYVKSLMSYLSGQWQQADNFAENSRMAEAYWLSGYIKYKMGKLSESIKSTEKALGLGLKAAKLQLVQLLLQDTASDRVKVHRLLNETIDHFRSIGRDDLVMLVEQTIDELQLSEEQPQLSLLQAAKRKSKKQKACNATDNRKKPISPSSNAIDTALENNAEHEAINEEKLSEVQSCPVSDTEIHSDKQERWLTRHEMALLYISFTYALTCGDHNHACQILTDASQKVNWSFQQATIARMDLWRLRGLANDKEYLNLLHSSGTKHHPVHLFYTIKQDNETLKPYKLDQQEGGLATFTDDIQQTQEVMRNLIINKAISWLCFLHTDDQDISKLMVQWQERPGFTTKELLNNFEYSLSMTFTTASFLSTIGHVYGDLANDCPCGKKSRRFKQKSSEFYSAANNFNRWRRCLKNDHKLSCRIANATPLGNVQKLRKDGKPDRSSQKHC